MKVSELLKPSVAAQIEGKSNLALKEYQKEKTNQENLSKNDQCDHTTVNINNIIDLLA